MVIFLLLIISFTIFFILTRRSIVRLTKGDNIRVEIHMQIWALVINPQRRQNKKHKSRKEKADSRRTILTAVRRLIKHSKVKINRLYIPFTEISDKSILSSVRRRIISATLISYLETIAEEIYILDNAITLSPDIDSLQCDISIECRLYQIIYAVAKLALHKLKEKIHVRE
jgi:hypothetical protein